MRPARRFGVALLLASAIGCGSAPPTVPLTGAWPAQAAADFDDLDDHYQEQTALWTRRGRVRTGYREVLIVDATLASPPWLAAKAARDGALAGDNAAERDARLAKVQADDATGYVVHLLVATWDRRENNLDRGAAASWAPVLIAENGARLSPSKIARDKRPRPVLRAEFAHLGDFAEAYTVTFPRDVALFRDDAKQIRMRLIGTEGAVELSWDAP